VDRSQGDIHPLGNPHYLLDPRNGKDVGRLIAGRLAELDPEGAQLYHDNAARLAASLDERTAACQELAAPARGRSVIIYHQHWEYLLHWLGIDILGAIEHRPGIAPSPKHVEQLILAARKLDGTVVLAAPWDHLDVARRVAERTDSTLLVLPGAVGSTDEATDYPRMFDVICSQLGAAFRTP
jgi:zinc/manganese transport system substrate-binding protein